MGFPIRWGFALTVFSMSVLVAGCGPAEKRPRKEKMVPTTSTSQISASGPVVADGTTSLSVQIILRDQQGSAMAGLQPVLSSSGSGNQISVCSVTNEAGESTCSMRSTKAETKELNLSSPVTLSPVSVEFIAGAPTQLGFGVQPSAGTVGETLVVQPVVEIQDANGNRVSSGSSSVSLTLASGTGNIGGTSSLSTSQGRAVFTNLSFDTAGAKSLRASATGLTAGTSASFNIAALTPRTLSFFAQPGGGSAGVAWSQQPVVKILNDSDSSVDTTSNTEITLTLTSGTGVLLGTKTVAAVSGVASFSGLKLESVGTFQITATAAGVKNAVSTSFGVQPGVPANLVFQTQPGGGTANTQWGTQPVVRIFDAYGNLCTNSSANVSLSVQSGTGTLSGTTTLAAVAGVASFSDLKMTVSGTKTLRATLAGVVADSTQFSIAAGAATKLVFTTQPGGGGAGVVWSAQPILEIQDAHNNKVTSAQNNVSLTVSTGTGSLIGTSSVTAVSGAVTFSGLKMTVAGSKVITASAGGLTSAISDGFTVQHGSPDKLTLVTPPSENLANTVLTTQPVVQIQDQYGNPITTGVDASAPVTVSLKSGTGNLDGTLTLPANQGVVSFSDLKFTQGGTKVLKFAKANLLSFGGAAAFSVDSLSFEALIGAPSKLQFVVQPGGAVAGVSFTAQPKVEIQDSAGNRVVSSSATVTINLQSGTGPLMGTVTATAVEGLAEFTNLKLTVPGAKSIRAQSPGLTSQTSNSFTVVHGPAASLAIINEPSNGIRNVVFPTQPKLQILDAYGNRVTSGADSTAMVTATLKTGTGLLSGTMALAAVGGVVTYTNLKVDQVGDKVLTYTKDDTSGSGGTTGLSADSATFTLRLPTVSLSQSQWSQDRVSVTSDGVETITLSGVLKESSGTLIVGKEIQLSSSRGGSDTISPSTQVTNASGQFSFTLSSTTAGYSKLTLTVPEDSLTFSTAPRAQFVPRSPAAEYTAFLAGQSANEMFPGRNSPSLGAWSDVALAGNADGSLQNFSFNQTNSGWMGNGGLSMTDGTVGPYRLGFDGSDDFVDLGSSKNWESSLSFEVWARPTSLTAGRSLMSNADATSGMGIRLAADQSRRWELVVGSQSYADRVLADAPEGYWRFSESSGTTAKAARGSDASYSGSGITYAQNGPLFSNEKAVQLNGSSGQINLGSSWNMGASDSISFEAWVYLTADGASTQTILAQQGGTSGLALEMNASEQPVFSGFDGTTPVSVTAASSVALATWTHLVGVRDLQLACDGSPGSHLAIWVNGSQADCLNLVSLPDPDTSALWVGNHPSLGGRWLQGRVDEVAVYRGALLSSQIQGHYSGRQTPTCYSGSVSNLTWVHLIAGFDAANEKLNLRVNGSTSCELDVGNSVSIQGATVPLSLGAMLDSSSQLISGTTWPGQIGEVRIYTHGLSNSEAAGHYSASSSKYP